MKRQQYLRRRLQTLSALRDAVGAMRALSALHFRRARLALASARQYRDEMNTVIAEIDISQSHHAGVPAGLLVIASDLGLCGDYNSRLAHQALSEAKQHAVHRVYSVGRRARAALIKHGLTPVRTYDAPASVEGLSQLLLGLAQDVLDDYVAPHIGSLYVVSAGFEGIGHFRPLSAQLLPIEPVGESRVLPASPYVAPAHLATLAVREFLYITLYEVLLDALAAEHGMRLVAAESALEWLDTTTTTTSRRLASARSESATQELLDIVSGRRQTIGLSHQ